MLDRGHTKEGANDFFEPSITKLVTRRTRDAIRFQAQQLGIEPASGRGSIPVAGHSAQRLHGTLGEDGREYFEILAAAANRLPGITRLNDAEATGLIASDEGVAGLIVRVAGGEQRSRRPARCSAAAASPQTEPWCASTFRRSPQHPTSAVVQRWPRHRAGTGARRCSLPSRQLSGTRPCHRGRQGAAGLGLTTLGAIMVDCNGRRFVREDIGPSELAAPCDGDARRIGNRGLRPASARSRFPHGSLSQRGGPRHCHHRADAGGPGGAPRDRGRAVRGNALDRQPGRGRRGCRSAQAMKILSALSAIVGRAGDWRPGSHPGRALRSMIRPGYCPPAGFPSRACSPPGGLSQEFPAAAPQVTRRATSWHKPSRLA